MFNKETFFIDTTNTCDLIRISNSNGAYVEILTYGAILKSIYVPDHLGNLENVVLAYKSSSDYLDNPGYLNAVIGRTSGRIANGIITIDGTTYSLTKNQATNTLHGGTHGISHNYWTIISKTSDSVTLQTHCPHLEDGYPGNVTIQLTYTFTNDNTLKLHYTANTDQTTVVNLTNHAYFNLSGNAKRPICNHILAVNSHEVIACNSDSTPSATILPVHLNPCFDFTRPKPIGQDIDTDHPQLNCAQGYDHPWLLDNPKCVTLVDPLSKRRLLMTTNQPSVVIYTHNHNTPCTFSNNQSNIKRYAICLETQNPPIGPDELYKNYSILTPDKTYVHTTSFKFDTI
ncbi:MAG: aldose epimerase family protein [Cellulosilyticaceae bacterium]